MAAVTTAGQNLSAIDAILKDVYEGPVNEQVNLEVLMYNILSGKEGGVKASKPVDFTGRRIVVPVHVRKNKGIGAVAENNLLPVAGKQQYADEIVQLAYLYGTIRLTGPVLEQATGNNEGAFIGAMQSEIKGMADGFTKDMNRQCYGTGNGVLATLSANAASGATSVSVNPTMWLEENDIVDIVDSGTGAIIAGNNVVTNVTYSQQGSSGMVYVTGVTFSTGISAAVTSGQSLVRNNGNSGANNWGAEVLGLQSAIGTGTYLNINPATYSVWQSTVLNGGGQPQSVSEILFQAAQANAKRLMGKKPTTIVTTDGVQAQFVKLLAAQKRFSDTKLRGGFSSIDFNGTEILADTDCPYGTAFVFNPDYFHFYHTRPAHWAETGGTVMRWDPNNTDAAIGTYRYYVQLAATNRRAHTLITNISE